MKTYQNYYLFILSLFILIIVPNLLQTGMFVDGVWYATISENLANGLGSFWKPVFTLTMFNPFYEHPPLVFGIQSLFFTAIGNGLFVEKLYALVIFIITIFMIKCLWYEIFFNDKKQRQLWFIPVLLWFLSETIYLMYTNNLLECTQELFIISSIIFILKAIRKNNYFYYFLSGIFILLSFLSKGITGTFPLISVLIYYFSIKEISLKKALLYNFIVVLGFSTIFILFIIEPDAYTNLTMYLKTQVLGSLKGENNNNFQENRFYILKALLQVNAIPIAFLLLFSISNRFIFKAKTNFLKYKKQIVFFVLIMLSGVLPIMIGKKQSAYYLITTIPFLAIALALIFIENKTLIQYLKSSKAFKIISLILLFFSFINSFNSINKINKRDQKLISDLTSLHSILKENKNSIIGAKTLVTEHSLYGYMMRYYKISLDTIQPFEKQLLITDKSTKINTTLYKKLNNTTLVFNLYEKK